METKKFSELPKEIKEAFLQGDWERGQRQKEQEVGVVLLDYEDMEKSEVIAFCNKYEQLVEDLEFELDEVEKMKAQSDRGIDLQIKRISTLEQVVKEKDEEIKRLNSMFEDIDFEEYIEENAYVLQLHNKEFFHLPLFEIAQKAVDLKIERTSWKVYTNGTGFPEDGQVVVCNFKQKEPVAYLVNANKADLFSPSKRFIYKFRLHASI